MFARLPDPHAVYMLVMALGATVHHFSIALSDVDRSVYETLDLRVAQHPSETMMRLLVRTLAYCLAHADGIAFSKGGLSSNEDPPIAVIDPTGRRLRWIEIGAPSPERLHKLSKSGPGEIYTHELAQLRRQIDGKTIHKAETIAVCAFDPAFLAELEAHVERRAELEVTRTDGSLYVTVDGTSFETVPAISTLGD